MTRQVGKAVPLAAVKRAQEAHEQALATPEMQAKVADFERGTLRQKRWENLQRAKPRLPSHTLDLIAKGELFRTGHLEVVQRWYERGRYDSPILCLAGLQGTGKDTAACWWLAEEGARYITAGELADWSNGTPRIREKAELIAQSKQVVLADLGTERDAALLLPALFNFVDLRQGRPYETIITTNLPKDPIPHRPSAESLKERYKDARLWSRLIGCWDYMASEGPDLRLQRRGRSR